MIGALRLPIAVERNLNLRGMMSSIGTSRRFAAMQNLIAIGDTADIEQAAPI
jgi:hypothetical protein